MGGFYTDSDIKTCHVARIFGIYIQPEYRGMRLGRRLLETIIAGIKTDKLLSKIRLEVTTSQEAALTLYKNLGFWEIGTAEKELFVDGKYYDEILMEMLI